MARLGIEDLPRQPAAYRIDRVPAPEPNALGRERFAFETADEALAEDLLRAARCDETVSDLFSTRTARRLAKRLRRTRRPNSLASSRCWRRQRIRMVGALWRFIIERYAEELEAGQVAVFCASPRSFEFTPEEQDGVRGSDLIARFRQLLIRYGGAQAADGFLIACIHGEWEPYRGVYRLHLHGLAAAGMIEALDRLRNHPDFDPRLDPNIGLKRNPPRVLISRKPLTNLPSAISYQFKSYWPSKRIGPVGKDGAVKRQRAGSRIAEPYHTQVLLWHDRQLLSEITLLMKARVSKTGFVNTTK